VGEGVGGASLALGRFEVVVRLGVGPVVRNFSRPSTPPARTGRGPRLTIRPPRMLLFTVGIQGRVTQVCLITVLALEVPPFIVVLTPTRLLLISVVVAVLILLPMAHLAVMVTHVLLSVLWLVLGHGLVVILTVRRLLIIGGRRLVLLVVHLLLHLHGLVHWCPTLLVHVWVWSVVRGARCCVHLAVSLLHLNFLFKVFPTFRIFI